MCFFYLFDKKRQNLTKNKSIREEISHLCGILGLGGEYMKNSYEINTSTLAIIPVDEFTSRVVEETTEYITEHGDEIVAVSIYGYNG